MTIILTRHPDDSWTLTCDDDLIVLEKVELGTVFNFISAIDAACNDQ